MIPFCSALPAHIDLVTVNRCYTLEWQRHQHLLCWSLRSHFRDAGQPGVGSSYAAFMTAEVNY